MSRAPNLADLPQDILNHFFKQLSPPLPPSWPLGGDPTPIPVDLHRVMLVCRRLHVLALPWAWRRLTIYINPRRPYLDDEVRFHLDNNDDHRLRHPTRFAHIRVFVLAITNTGAEQYDPVPVLTTLKSCVSLMENLQVLIFGCYGDWSVSVGDIDIIYTLLLSKPRLHTLVTSNNLPAVDSPSTSLKRLHVNATGGWFNVPPFLESLFIVDARVVLASPIPWSTLREIHFNHFSVAGIVKDFSAWKQTIPETCSPLNEISIENRVVSSVPPRECLDRVFHVFQTQDIHIISLIDLGSVDADLIDRIVEAFPGVRNLTLVANFGVMWSLSSVEVP